MPRVLAPVVKQRATGAPHSTTTRQAERVDDVNAGGSSFVGVADVVAVPVAEYEGLP